MADNTEGQLATKVDLADLRAAIEGRLAKLQTDIAWITGLYFPRSIVEWLR